MQFTWPLDDYILTRDFYYLASFYVLGQHAAIDLIRRTGVTRAAPIRVVANGTAVGNGWDIYSGFFFAADHADGFRSFYRHLNGPSPIPVGQQVMQGQIIGNVGNTGASEGDHLHFDLWNKNKIRDDNAIFFKNGWYAVDPVKYLGREDTMATVKEITDLLNGMSHHLVFGKDMILDQMKRISTAEEKRAVTRHNAVITAIKGIGGAAGGATPAQVKAAVKAAIRELVKAG